MQMINRLKTRLYTLLRWSEKYVKTDMVYLAKGGFWLTLGRVGAMLSGLVLSVAFANLLPKETYGTYQYIISIASIVSVFTLTGMGTAIMRAAAQGSHSSLRYGTLTQLKWSIGIVVLSFLLAFYYYIKENSTLSIAFFIVGIFQPLMLAFSLYRPYLTGRQLFRESAVFEIIQNLLPFSTLLLAVFLTDNVVIIILAYFAPHTFAYFFIYRYIVHTHKVPYKPDLNVKNYSKHLSVMSSFGAVVGNLDKVLIWHFLGAVPVAIYTLAQVPISQMKNITQMILSLIFPKLANKSLPELKTTLPGKLGRYFIFIATGVTAYILAAPLLFDTFFPAYKESVIYSQVLALSVLAAPRKVMGQAFVAHMMKREQYILNISTPAVRLISLIVLLPLYGIWGAVSAVLLVNLYEAALNLFLFRRATAIDSTQESINISHMHK